jgi:hypothetical protein
VWENWSCRCSDWVQAEAGVGVCWIHLRKKEQRGQFFAARLICSKISSVTALLLPCSVEEDAWSRKGERKEWRRLLERWTNC